MRRWCIAGAVGISSSAIVTKILVEMHRLTNRETRLILGIVVVEDLFLAVYLAALQPVLDESATAGDAVLSFAKAFGFLVIVALVARYGASVVGRSSAPSRTSSSPCASSASRSWSRGSPRRSTCPTPSARSWPDSCWRRPRSHPACASSCCPLRDTFAALFFFTFGLTVDPGDVASVAGPDRRSRS